MLHAGRCSTALDAHPYVHVGSIATQTDAWSGLQNFLYGFISDTLLAPYILPGAY